MTEQSFCRKPVCPQGAAVRSQTDPLRCGKNTATHWRVVWALRLWRRGALLDPALRAEAPAGPWLGLGGVCPRTGGVALLTPPTLSAWEQPSEQACVARAPLARWNWSSNLHLGRLPAHPERQLPHTATGPKHRCCSSLFLTCSHPWNLLLPRPGPASPWRAMGCWREGCADSNLLHVSWTV